MISEALTKMHDGDGTVVKSVFSHYQSIKNVLPEKQKEVVFSAVVNICRDSETFSEAKKLWEDEYHSLYVKPWMLSQDSQQIRTSPLHADMARINALKTYCNNLSDTDSVTSFPRSSIVNAVNSRRQIPPLPLAEALLHSASKAGDPIWRELFELSKRDAWNTSPHYSGDLWSIVLHAAGRLKDESGVLGALREIQSCNVHLPNVSPDGMIEAINAITSDEKYVALKEILALFPTKTLIKLRHRYVELRNAEKLPLNDKIFYHVHWLFHTRKPMHFLPRRLYFDYKPSTSKSDAVSQKKGLKDIMKQRVELWKKEGTLPEDFDENSVKVGDKIEATIERLKKEPWRKRTYSPGQQFR